MALWERANLNRSLDYPISIVQLKLKPGGATGGTGEIDVAAKVDADSLGKTIVIENFDVQPVQLTAVRRVK